MDRFLTLSREDRLEALSVASDAAERPMHLLEKDVWVVWALNTAFVSPFGPHLTFKGGTSLSKAYGLIQRFSEDVDLTYDVRQLVSIEFEGADDALQGFDLLPESTSQQRRITKLVRERLPIWVAEVVVPLVTEALGAEGLAARIEADGDVLFIHYEPLVTGTGYVAPRIMLEFGARSSGEPSVERDIVCDAALHLPMLRFPTARPRVMLAERTFWEKATAIHVYCLQNQVKGHRFVRHWHDLARLHEAGITASAIDRRDIADAVARHKSWFFAAKDVKKEPIDYAAAVAGQVSLVPTGDALNALRIDYEAMIADGLLAADAESFDQLMGICRQIESALNAR